MILVSKTIHKMEVFAGSADTVTNAAMCLIYDNDSQVDCVGPVKDSSQHA